MRFMIVGILLIVGACVEFCMAQMPPELSIIKDDFVLQATGNTLGKQVAIASNSSGLTVAVWQSGSSNIDIIAQRLDIDGELIGQQILVNDSSGAQHYGPAVAVSETGHFVVAWGDQRTGSIRSMFQLFAPNGDRIGDNVDVFETIGSISGPQVCFVSNNLFAIIGEGGGTCGDGYLRIFDLNQNAVSELIQLTDSGVMGATLWPNIKSGPDGKIYAVWYDCRESENFGALYYQQFDSLGVKQGTNVLLAIDGYYPWGLSGSPPALEVLPDGDFVVCYAAEVARKQYYARFDVSGSQKGARIEYASDATWPVNYQSAAVCSDGYALAVWSLYSGTSFNARLVAPTGTIGAKFQVQTLSEINVILPRVSSSNNRFFVIWHDGRNDLVLAKVYEVDAVSNSVLDNEGASMPTGFVVNQNYPNPFNASTVIEYETHTAGPVTLDIYNILGQRVYEYRLETQTPGSHTFRWNGHDQAGEDVPSGVYFYRVSADGVSESRKMVLLK